ncbi:hypothetical protein COUCH_32325 [Couchioplanes caeruleus]|uniref:hypothetical protein n=1 Tax=Couchioplanes caeruleus TaxID=56438 RepID=UPI0020BE99C6|nr:hypothetical protein [Couchioplanes caeruleus]UQU63638.1 hypothetical protein COUCH_32325 [Couchioplanes caeruleus]
MTPKLATARLPDRGERAPPSAAPFPRFPEPAPHPARAAPGPRTPVPSPYALLNEHIGVSSADTPDGNCRRAALR